MTVRRHLMETVHSKGVRLSLRGLKKSFSSREVLLGIDLDLDAGEFVAIVGRSGCGKSTLLRLVAGLDSPDRGLLLRDDAWGDPLHDTRLMFQEPRLLPWKRVLDNVAVGLAREGRETARSTLERVGLLDRAGDWPYRLSGGQRQRVALARALAHRPRLLLLDEPLGALDALTRLEMHALIETLWSESGFTALLVTHDVAEAVALADRVVVLEEGRVTLDLRIDLPRPRLRGDAEVAALEERVLRAILGSGTSTAQEDSFAGTGALESVLSS